MTEKDLKILIVDDDPTVLKYLSQSLPTPDGRFSVITAASGAEALEILSREKIFLVISDIRMENMSGIHLLNEIRTHYDHVKTILITAYETKDIQHQISESGCLKLLSKPVKSENLRHIIQELIKEQEKGFAGTLKNIQLSDIIQMCCHSEVNMAIRVTKNENQGTIYITGGNIVHATCKGITGEEAFYEIMDWKSGSFETLSVETIPEETIEKNWVFLLIEASRKEDEQQADDLDSELDEDAAEDEFDTAAQDLGFELSDEEDGGTDNDNNFLSEKGNNGAVVHHQQAAAEIQVLNVLIVDDSSMMIKILADILSQDGNINVVGSAKNGEEALKQIELLNPDLITLDVNMPIMDGSTALKHIMIKTPCPVVIISNPGKRSQLNILDFLRLGAVDFIKKPARSGDMSKQHMEIIQTIRQAASANTSNFRRARMPKTQKAQKAEALAANAMCKHLVVINSGSGGHGEVIKLISMLSFNADTCILILQKMPKDFIVSFSEFFNESCEFQVMPLDGQRPLWGGICYIGSHDQKIFFFEKDHLLSLECNPTDQTMIEQNENVDQLLAELTDFYSGQLTVVYLSGASIGNMEGLAEIKSKPSDIIIQKSDECMVSGPLEQIKNDGLFDHEFGLSDIAKHIGPTIS